MDIAVAIIHHYGGGVVNFTVKDGKLYWEDEVEPKPTAANLTAWYADYESAQITSEYIENRQGEYPSIGDQLDYIYHNGLVAWKANVVKPVKDKWPKPE